jgi:hypothetical protein
MRSNWVRNYKTWLDRPLALPQLVKSAEAAAPDPALIAALPSGGADAARMATRSSAGLDGRSAIGLVTHVAGRKDSVER